MAMVAPSEGGAIPWPLGATSYAMRTRIGEAKVLVVGAGGIGCELLKTLAMSGFKNLVVIDLDTIETSNLNRQFLFRQQHVGQSKASVAAAAVQAIVPGVSITAHRANVKEARFSADFVSGFDLVLNGLDNLEARRHVNRLCLAARVPLVESGTAGYLGQVSVHLGGVTECFECQPKPVPKTYPVCTIRNTPDKPIHCIVWAKDLLFARLFGPPEAATDLDDAGEDPGDASAEAATTAGPALLRRSGEPAEEYALRVFQAVFVADMERLAGVEEMWKGREPPTPCALDLAAVGERVRLAEESAAGRGPGVAASGMSSALGLPDAQRAWAPEDSAAVFLASVRAFLTHRAEEVGALRFDKDDALATEFVAAAANLRSHCYGIPPQTLFEAKGMAGNIIHAVATTNAIASGLIVVEAMKLLAGQSKACHTTFLLAEASNKKLLTPMQSPEPNPNCVICGKAQLLLHADLHALTLGDLITQVLRGRMALVEPTLVAGSFMYEEGEDLEEDEVAFHSQNLTKPLSQLPGGGFATGTLVEVTDQAQQTSFRILVQHKDTWDEDAEPLRWEIRGELPASTFGKEGAGPQPDDGSEVEEEGFEIVEEGTALPSKTAAELRKRPVDGVADSDGRAKKWRRDSEQGVDGQ